MPQVCDSALNRPIGLSMPSLPLDTVRRVRLGSKGKVEVVRKGQGQGRSRVRGKGKGFLVYLPSKFIAIDPIVIVLNPGYTIVPRSSQNYTAFAALLGHSLNQSTLDYASSLKTDGNVRIDLSRTSKNSLHKCF